MAESNREDTEPPIPFSLGEAINRISSRAQLHQRNAITAALNHWMKPGNISHKRALIVLPPGAGKTMLGLWTFEAISPNKGVLLIVTETLPLIDQTVDAYKQFDSSFATGDRSILAVASKHADHRIQRAESVKDIANFLMGDTERVILSTYASLHKVANAQKETGRKIDLAIFDEAHRMAGKGLKFRLGLDNSKLTTERRLFLTATPRLFGREGSDSEIISMDDATVFGPKVFSMSMREAETAHITVPLKVLCYNLSNAYHELVKKNPNITILMEKENIPVADAALVAGVLDVFNNFGARRGFLFQGLKPFDALGTEYTVFTFISHSLGA